jgi:uroporphyrinogen-III synthase
VLVTRPEHQAENLTRLISQHDGIAVLFPTLAIVAMDDSRRIHDKLAQLDKFQWLVFISANAVRMHSYYADSDKIKQLKSLRIAAIGKATAEALQRVGLPIDLVPVHGYSSEALLEMPQMQMMQGQNCLIVRGEGGLEELATALRTRGACVEYLDVYKRIIPDIDCTKVALLLQHEELDVITVTSGESLCNLLVMVEQKHHHQLIEIPLVVISNRIRQIAADLGFKRIAVTTSPSDEAILETVKMCVTGGIEWPN